MIHRRRTRQIQLGKVKIGGDAPISVQSMTKTDTRDVRATVQQIWDLEAAGCEIVRCAVPVREAAEQLGEIKRRIRIPLVADIHFNYKLALIAIEQGVEGLRLNPGNIGARKYVEEVVKAASERRIPIRIGVNAGSLEPDLLEKYGEPCPEAMVESALNHAKILDDLDFREYKISVKASDPFLAVAAYQALSEAIDCPLHVGITEAGGMISGTVKSSIGMGMLLWSGIGDTIRVSLSADPVEEVRVGFDILKSLNLRHRGVNIISCPSCARQGFNVIDTVKTLEDRLKHISTPMSLSIIGCVVNGPGEARETDLGFTGGGAGKGHGQIYLNGEPSYRIDNGNLVEHIVELCEKKAAEIEAQRNGEAAKTPLEAAQ